MKTIKLRLVLKYTYHENTFLYFFSLIFEFCCVTSLFGKKELEKNLFIILSL